MRIFTKHQKKMATRLFSLIFLALGCVGAKAFQFQTRESPALRHESCLGFSKLLINQTGYTQYAHYYTDIPELTGFTMHYWFKLNKNFRSATTFNYALDAEVNTDNVTLQLHQGKQLHSPSHWTLHINDVLVVRLESPPVLAGRWHHMLHSWDSTQGAWSVFMDGGLLGYGYSEEGRGLVIPAGGIAVSGQHQNTAQFNGMDQGEGIEGWFTLFNMFSRPLLYPNSRGTLAAVARIARQCSPDQPEGDVISWRSTPRKGYGGIMETPAIPVCGKF
ncbi:C-reactive protein 1.4 isoform X1 [Penaeus vannamei]|uniref:C-reactive protein 1.4 isoform X1 n=1 Tax=Penaeus vannamei TaxID=6689 RepID=UPI000F6818F6|nr:neuronal pentraxin receptor-like isoform X1 [Penaeus vannamei]